MGRWLLLVASLVLVGSLAYSEVYRAPDAASLGGVCESTHGCRHPTRCVEQEGVVDGQCSASCNSTAACQAQFGDDALCLGADLCVRACDTARPCPAQTVCNAYGWCERLTAP